METDNIAGRQNLLSSQRPTWQRLLIWGGIAFAALNILPLVFLFTGNILTGGFGTFVLVVGLFIAVSLPFGGLNLVRSWANKATADFKRLDDPVRGGYIYDVRPARASWLAVLVPLPLCAFLALWGAFAGWIFYAAMMLYFVVAAIFVLPGAKYRKAVTISVSPQGIHSGDVNLPLDRVADLSVGYNGVKVSEDPLMPGRNGVSTSAMIGRGLGNRQASRSFTLMLRGDGSSRAAVIAGGLTQDCAENLQRDIQNAVARFGTSH